MDGERLNLSNGGEAKGCVQNMRIITVIILKCVKAYLECSNYNYYIIIQHLIMHLKLGAIMVEVT